MKRAQVPLLLVHRCRARLKSRLCLRDTHCPHQRLISSYIRPRTIHTHLFDEANPTSLPIILLPRDIILHAPTDIINNPIIIHPEITLLIDTILPGFRILIISEKIWCSPPLLQDCGGGYQRGSERVWSC